MLALAVCLLLIEAAKNQAGAIGTDPMKAITSEFRVPTTTVEHLGPVQHISTIT